MLSEISQNFNLLCSFPLCLRYAPRLATFCTMTVLLENINLRCAPADLGAIIIDCSVREYQSILKEFSYTLVPKMLALCWNNALTFLLCLHI